MFRKIVSNIAFSPALVGQLGFYANRLRKEEVSRRFGLIFTALALVVQSFAVFSPPEAVNAASSADFVRGGVSSMTEFLRYYDKNHRNIKALFNQLGITRAELKAAGNNVKTIGEASRYNWSMTSLYSHKQGQRSYAFKKADGSQGKVFYRPMRLTQTGGDKHRVYVGHSAVQGWFAIKIDCGNLITEKPPVAPNAECVNLRVTALSPTRFRFNAKASTKHGADIRGYDYFVKNDKGKVVKKIKQNSTKRADKQLYERSIPGKYTVVLEVRTSVGVQKDADCKGKFRVPKPKEPAAECKNVHAAISDRTIVSLSGSATTDNGAKIKKYIFTVKDGSGTTVKTVEVASSKLKVVAPSFTLAQVGNYTVTLTLQTSLGDRSDPEDCAKPFKIAPKDVCPYNPSLPPNDPDCQPCPENPDIWIKDEKCNAELINLKTATNISQGNVDASTVDARASDRISYTVTVENVGLAAEKVTMTESLEDVMQYAALIDTGSGSFDKEAKTLTWPEMEVAPHGKESRTFVVKLLDSIPTTNTGTSDASSYDCVMTNTFGNSIDVAVECPREKVLVEQTVSELPQTGPRENMIFAAILLSVVVYFYARSRQLKQEVRLIRRDVNAGTI